MMRPPRSEAELLERALALAGRPLAALAADLGLRPPADLRGHKGWVGDLLERALGADAGSLPEPDFRRLGVELKTLPINRHGLPRESTYVCTTPLDRPAGRWEDSAVWGKLRRVLWMPVEAEPDLPIAERRVGMPLLWSPDPEQARGLRADWEELMDMVCMGQLEAITARHGTWLQIRPKAANARALTFGVGPSGEQVLTLPRGFYLRTSFTAAVLRQHFVLPGD